MINLDKVAKILDVPVEIAQKVLKINPSELYLAVIATILINEIDNKKEEKPKRGKKN